MRLNSVSYNNPGAYAVNQKDESLYARVSGLPFVNSTYSVKSQGNTGRYDMVMLTIAAGQARTLYYTPNVSMAQFQKGSNLVNITIELLRTIDDLPPDLAATLPHFSYHFDIYPVSF